MTNINISVPESLKSFIDYEIVEGGYSSASEYLQQLIIQEAQRKSKASLEEFLITQEELEKLEDELRKLNEQKFGVLVNELDETPKDEESNSDSEVKRLSYLRSHG